MGEPHAITHPRFQLRWLLAGRQRYPDWLDDETWIPPGDRTLFARAKQGLYAALTAYDSESEGVVLLPAYAPGGVVWAALYAGYDVRYYPVNEDLSLPTAAVAAQIESHDPAAIVFIHYFGFVDEHFRDLAAIASDVDALVIEDCARGLFSRDPHGQLLGSTGDVALYCLHKTLPVPNGGLVVSDRLSIPEPDVSRPEWRRIPQLAALSVARVGHVPIDHTPTVRRAMNRGVSSVSPPERSSRPGGLTLRALSQCRPERVQSAREGRYRALETLLSKRPSLTVVSPPVHCGASPYGVAALAPSSAARSRHLRALRSRGLPCEVLTWPPVHEHERVSTFAGAETLRERLLVIPTHQQLDPGAIGRMASIVASGAGLMDPPTQHTNGAMDQNQ